MFPGCLLLPGERRADGGGHVGEPSVLYAGAKAAGIWDPQMCVCMCVVWLCGYLCI